MCPTLDVRQQVHAWLLPSFIRQKQATYWARLERA